MENTKATSQRQKSSGHPGPLDLMKKDSGTAQKFLCCFCSSIQQLEFGACKCI